MSVLRLNGSAGHSAANLARIDAGTESVLDVLLEMQPDILPSVMVSSIVTLMMMLDDPARHWGDLKKMVDDGILRALTIGDVEGQA